MYHNTVIRSIMIDYNTIVDILQFFSNLSLGNCHNINTTVSIKSKLKNAFVQSEYQSNSFCAVVVGGLKKQNKSLPRIFA